VKTIKLANLDYVASWPTAPDDTTVREVGAIATKVAPAWPRSRDKFSLSNLAKMTIGQDRAGCISSALLSGMEAKL
jgi:hypothetical protein